MGGYGTDTTGRHDRTGTKTQKPRNQNKVSKNCPHRQAESEKEREREAVACRSERERGNESESERGQL